MSKKEQIRIQEADAKAGRRVKGMPYVLGVSVFVIIAALAIVYVLFAA